MFPPTLPGPPSGVLQDVLVKEQPLVYNKEDLLNPAFVVFGKRRSAAAAGEVAPASGGA